MEFSNTFTVKASIEQVWDFMLDAREVAPCVPGAELTESVDATHHKGTVKVKLGAVQMSYRGELEMLPNREARPIVLNARGTETRGSGGASGVFTTKLASTDDGGTLVEIHTRVDVTGRVAQFGRGIMQDVAGRMIKQFAACIEAKLVEREAASHATGEPAPSGDTSPAANAPPAENPTSTATSRVRTVPETQVSTTAPPMPAFSPAPTAPWLARQQPNVRSSNELRLAPLILGLLRSRTAAGLRALAGKIEPDET